MPTLLGVNYSDAVRALEKIGFRQLCDGRHVVMADDSHKLTIPRCNPVNSIAMGGIVRDAGLTIEEFRKLL
jgi:predicted RNA binding protein YcfA (HicA-like mRNA interferase family)